MSRYSLLVMSLLAVAGCAETPSAGDPDLGMIDQVISFSSRVNWPGLDEGGGRRKIITLRGFADGQSIGYWFLGFGSRETADAFFFCRNGDEACPLDEHHRVNWSHLVGNPLFTRMPGDPDASQFWQMWVARVPADYEPNTIKTPETLDAYAQKGIVNASRLIVDFGEMFGEKVGSTMAILHCSLVLEHTYLAEADLPILDLGGRILRPPLKKGWINSHQVSFFDFSPIEGVSPADANSDSRALMRIANVYIIWRGCQGDGPKSPICDISSFAGGNNTLNRPVSERGVGQDFTGNKLDFDTNNTFAASPCSRVRSAEIFYSPLWGPKKVVLDEAVRAIDTYVDKNQSDIKSADDVFAAVARNYAPVPTIMKEDETGNPITANGGQVLFDCPFVVNEDFVPWPLPDRSNDTSCLLP